MSTFIQIWPGSASYSGVEGNTPFGIYDGETAFISESVHTAHWCTKKMGYPIVDVELQDIHFFACFEEAINEYAAQVNQFNIRENIYNLQGAAATESNLTHQEIAPTFGNTIRLAENYGSEAGSGGNTTWYHECIQVSGSQQTYDLTDATIWSGSEAAPGSIASQSLAAGKSLEVKRVLHHVTPSIVRYFDPYAGTALGMDSLLSEVGMSNYSPGIQFMMMPLYGDILRLQGIEFHDQIRKSAYSFEIHNNQLRIFPDPTYDFKLWIDYVIKEDRNDPIRVAPGNVTDYSNAGYQHMTYTVINEVGKQWIRRYTLALSKELLGTVRSKYSSIPIPNAEVSMDGSDLRSEAQTEKEALITELRENLEASANRAQLEKESEKSENLENLLKRVPLKIYVG